MWNLKPGCKLVQQRIKQKVIKQNKQSIQNYQIHRQKLKSMRSLIKLKQPYQPNFIYQKLKLQLSRRDRITQIDKHNQILVNKINLIKLADYDTNKLRPQAQNLKTLNQFVMNQTNQKIIQENKRICSKLLKIKTFYPTEKILDKTDQLQRVCYNISYNARRAKSAKSRSSTNLFRPKSGYTTYSSAKKHALNMNQRNNFQDNKYSTDKINYNDMPSEQNQQDVKKSLKGRSYSAKNFMRSGSSRPDSAPTFKKLRKIVLKEQNQQ